jgi:tRNA G37 N-methylase Trm5
MTTRYEAPPQDDRTEAEKEMAQALHAHKYRREFYQRLREEKDWYRRRNIIMVAGGPDCQTHKEVDLYMDGLRYLMFPGRSRGMA